MVYNMTMKVVSVADAKAHLSSLLDEVENGESVTITRHNVPVAEIRALAKPNTGPRPWGLGKGTFVVPDDFNDPLPDDLLAAFEGRAKP
jgi:antitoxin (DNA-binding transcriptional repressor) of toxin-antitoxin stability system